MLGQLKGNLLGCPDTGVSTHNKLLISSLSMLFSIIDWLSMQQKKLYLYPSYAA